MSIFAMLSLAPANLPGSARKQSNDGEALLALTLAPEWNRCGIDSAEKASRA